MTPDNSKASEHSHGTPRGDASWVTRLLMKVGVYVPVRHRSWGFSQYLGRFLRDYKNNFLYVLSQHNFFLGSTLSIQFLRPALNRWRGVRIGSKVGIGDHVRIGLNHPELISIGDNCRISDNVMLIEHGRDIACYQEGMAMTELPGSFRHIVIGRNCHLGVGTIVLPGATIGEGCIIGAGAVVREDVPPYSLVIGNPAKVVGSFRLPPTRGRQAE